MLNDQIFNIHILLISIYCGPSLAGASAHPGIRPPRQTRKSPVPTSGLRAIPTDAGEPTNGQPALADMQVFHHKENEAKSWSRRHHWKIEPWLASFTAL